LFAKPIKAFEQPCANRASLLLGGASACAVGSVLVYPFLSAGNVKNVKSLK
jgi:hypothetical protein